MSQPQDAAPRPPATDRGNAAPRRQSAQGTRLPAIKGPTTTAKHKKPGNGSREEGLLTNKDLNAIKGFIICNQNIPFQHRRGAIQKFIPDTPFKKPKQPCDNVTGLQLSPLMPLESSIDVPIRFEPPTEFYSPTLVDPRSTATPVQQLFSFMKRSVNPAVSSAAFDSPERGSRKGTGARSGFKSLDPKDYMLRALTCRRANQRKQEAIAYFNTAAIHYSSSDFDKAVELLLKNVAVLEQLADKVGLALAHNLLGVCNHRLEKYKTAIHHYKKQEALCGYYGRTVAQINMGVAYSALEEKAFAVQALLDAVDNCRMTQDMCIESIALGNLGLAYLRNGNLRGAQENLEACMELCSLSGDEAGASVCLLLLGEVFSLVKDHKRAQFYYANALRVSTEGGVKDVQQVARVSLGISRGNDKYSGKCMSLANEMKLHPQKPVQSLQRQHTRHSVGNIEVIDEIPQQDCKQIDV
ncbi:hypothetical protein DIPPA_59178 [Diplonema papillatum]|nr:hypothetical protein DIPPA_59178 [Diplonema papillatum]